MLSNHSEWSSSNWCLRKIISSASGAKKGLIFDGAGVGFMGLYSKDNGGRKTIPQVIRRCQETRRPPRGRGGGRWGCRRLLYLSWRVANRCRFSACYPSASASGHKWIWRLTFQGSEQQMISSSKAKDKETKAYGFLLRKHRVQTLCARGCRANSNASTVCFSG